MKKAVRNTLLIVAPVALGVGAWWTFFRGGDAVPNKASFIDVTTGQVVYLKHGSYLVIPAPNTEGRYVLYPFEKSESGTLAIPGRYLAHLKGEVEGERLGAHELKVDLETGTLKTGE